MDLAMAVAVYRNAVIGAAGDVPWSGAVERHVFARVAAAKPLIMGRGTYMRLRGRMPLDGAVVVSRDQAFFPRDVMVRTTVSAAYNVCARLAKGMRAREAVVIGGPRLYRLALPVTDRVYLAAIDAERVGDGHFPLLRPAEWESLPPRMAPPQGDRPGFEMRVYRRRTGPAARAAMTY
jgi:dihydrofolate reductase